MTEFNRLKFTTMTWDTGTNPDELAWTFAIDNNADGWGGTAITITETRIPIGTGADPQKPAIAYGGQNPSEDFPTGASCSSCDPPFTEANITTLIPDDPYTGHVYKVYDLLAIVKGHNSSNTLATTFYVQNTQSDTTLHVVKSSDKSTYVSLESGGGETEVAYFNTAFLSVKFDGGGGSGPWYAAFAISQTTYEYDSIVFDGLTFEWAGDSPSGTPLEAQSALQAQVLCYEASHSASSQFWIISGHLPTGPHVSGGGLAKSLPTTQLFVTTSLTGSSSVQNPDTPSGGWHTVDMDSITQTFAEGSDWGNTTPTHGSGSAGNFGSSFRITAQTSGGPVVSTAVTSSSPTTSAIQVGELAGAFLSVEFADQPGTYTVFAQTTTICFHGDTLIETDKGRIAARDLKRGDMVKTYQEGCQPISRAIKVHTGGRKKFVVMEKDALKPGVPSETYMSTTGHPLKYGNRYVCPGQLATSQYTKNNLIRIERVKCDAYYSLQFDKHYTFNANGVESQSLPTTTSWCCMALPKKSFHDQTLYDKSKIGKGNDSAFLHKEAELVLPLTKEEVETFRNT